MKKMLLIAAILGLAAFLPSFTAESAKTTVVYTWTLADLGQGLWGGGPLYSDGSTAGNLPISVNNGQLILHLQPTSWSEPFPGFINLCFDVRMIKGTPPIPDDSFCFGDLGLLLPVTGRGMPLIIPNLENPDINLLIRITPVQ